MNVFVWSNADLDGVGSVILLGNLFKNIEYRGVFFGDFDKEYAEWAEENESKYDKIFVVGMSLEQSSLNKIDDKKVVIINDRVDDITAKKSKLVQRDDTSCTKIIYNTFKDALNASKNLKRLVVYVDDYNSYKLQTTEARFLNGLYRKSGSQRFYRFINRFWDGYDGLTDSEKKKAELFFTEIEKELESIPLYYGVYDGHNVTATFSEQSVNEIAGAILDTHGVEIAIVVNLRNRYVSFRKLEGSTADIKYMAENLCNGGGGEHASGGELTNKFAEFTQSLKEVAS